MKRKVLIAVGLVVVLTALMVAVISASGVTAGRIVGEGAQAVHVVIVSHAGPQKVAVFRQYAGKYALASRCSLPGC